MIKRNSNIELLRIVATLLVIILHVLGQGGILSHASSHEVNYWAAWFLEILAYCAVNCFALITGYVMVNKRIKVKNIIALWFHVLFYSLIITALFFAFLPESINIDNFISAFLPVVKRQWWYITSYFVMYLFIPLLNKLVDHISRQTYKNILIILLVACSIDCIVPINIFLLKDGYSALWLSIVYLFGAYIRKYDVFKKITAFKSLLGYCAMILLTFASKYIIYISTKNIFGQAKFENTFISYISITILFAAIFLLLFCLNIKIGDSVSKLICFLSPAALGVYLIHVHPLVFGFIIKDAFVSFVQKPPMGMILYVLITTLSIYVVCTVIELLRIKFFELIKVYKFCEMIDSKVNDFYFHKIKKQK